MPFTLTMPKLSPTMEEGMIAKWHKKEGDFVEAGELILEVATDKATVEYNVIDAGWLRKILVKENVEAKVNQAIAVFTEEQNESIENYTPTGAVASTANAQAPAAVAKMQEQQPAAPVNKPSFSLPEPPLASPEKKSLEEVPSGRILASPLAKKLAKEQGIDLALIKGSGPNQRIMKRDLENAPSASKTTHQGRLQPQHPPGAYYEEAMTPIRKVIGQRLQEAKSSIPHFYVQKAIHAESLLSFREQLQKLDVKVSVNDCIVKACALALKEYPNVNSGYHSANQTLIRFQTVDIAVAVTVQGGLITPIVRYADFKSLTEISKEIRELAKRAKEGKLDATEYKGGSFTISNLGMYGVTDFQAIINPPQAAILSVSSILDVPVVKNGCVVPGKVMNVTLSSDHRVVDGVAAAEFLNTLQKYLESPVSLLL